MQYQLPGEASPNRFELFSSPTRPSLPRKSNRRKRARGEATEATDALPEEQQTNSPPAPGIQHASTSGQASSSSAAVDAAVESFQKLSITEGKLTYSKKVTISMICPCEGACGKYVQIGPNGHYATEASNKCPRCKEEPSKYWESPATFRRHLTTKKCMMAQDSSYQHTSAKKSLGPETVHYVNSPQFKATEDGKVRFKCPKCDKISSDRWDHSKICLTANNVDISK